MVSRSGPFLVVFAWLDIGMGIDIGRYPMNLRYACRLIFTQIGSESDMARYLFDGMNSGTTFIFHSETCVRNALRGHDQLRCIAV